MYDFDNEDLLFGPPASVFDKLFVPKDQIVTNARVKQYLTKDVVQVATSPIFSAGDYVTVDGSSKRDYIVPSKGFAVDQERSLFESKRRARSKVRDISLCNHFEYMFTWTLNPDLVNRCDEKEVYKRVRAFLSNATQRKDFVYVLIPEYHKSVDSNGKSAIHFHGLCNLGDVQIKPAVNPHTKRLLFTSRHQQIFNMRDWKLGFSTCVPLDGEYEKAVNYIVKYITKDTNKIFGKWYLSSRGLKKAPYIIPLDNIDYEQFRDAEKLARNEQYETVLNFVRSQVKIINEVCANVSMDE